MSRIGRGATALVILLVGAGPAVRAQTADERVRIERLERRVETLVARRNKADSATEVRHDTLRVGPILVLTDSAASPLLREALRDLEGTVRRGLGTQPLPMLSGIAVVVRFGPANPAWVRLIADGAQFVPVHTSNTTPRSLSRQIAHGVLTALAQRGAMTTWGADLHLFTDPGPLWKATFIELATSPLPGNRRCYEGDLATCEYMLRLTVDTDPAPAGATVGLGRYVQSRLSDRANQPARAPLYADCVERDAAAACVELLATAGIAVPTASSRAAGTVLFTAMAMGGDGALARWFADTSASPAARLAAAAEAPLDSILGVWRATLLTHRPSEATVATGAQWLTLLWAIVLTVLATRSTRWR